MADIQRYENSVDQYGESEGMQKDSDGGWVEYEDHKRIVDELKSKATKDIMEAVENTIALYSY